MNETCPGSGPDDGESGSWTSETLPLHVRRQLLERELRKLGFRKEGVAQQQAQGVPSLHPVAGHRDTGAGEDGA